MAIREKAKNLFKRRSSRSDSLSKTSSKESSRDRWPSNVYKPGETMPKPKYRRPPEKAHKDKLDAFRFGDAWRKKSFQSQHSPMGTRLPSRRNSFLNFRKSLASRNASRNTSLASDSRQTSINQHKDSTAHARRPPRLSAEIVQAPDQHSVDVEGPRLASPDRDLPLPPTTAGAMSSNSLTPNYMSTAHDHRPFSEDEIVLALKKTHLSIPAS